MTTALVILLASCAGAIISAFVSIIVTFFILRVDPKKTKTLADAAAALITSAQRVAILEIALHHCIKTISNDQDIGNEPAKLLKVLRIATYALQQHPPITTDASTH